LYKFIICKDNSGQIDIIADHWPLRVINLQRPRIIAARLLAKMCTVKSHPVKISNMTVIADADSQLPDVWQICLQTLWLRWNSWVSLSTSWFSLLLQRMQTHRAATRMNSIKPNPFLWRRDTRTMNRFFLIGGGFNSDYQFASNEICAVQYSPALRCVADERSAVQAVRVLSIKPYAVYSALWVARIRQVSRNRGAKDASWIE
jgi:hypothetical protein